MVAAGKLGRSAELALLPRHATVPLPCFQPLLPRACRQLWRSVANPQSEGCAASLPLPAWQEFDWSPWATGTVADVGGGVGHVLAALLQRNPGMHGILLDRWAVRCVVGLHARLSRSAMQTRMQPTALDARAASCGAGDNT